MFGQTSNTKMKELLIFESVEELIADCKRNNSLLWMTIRDLEKDYHHRRNVNDTVEKLEEISETLDALASVLSK